LASSKRSETAPASSLPSESSPPLRSSCLSARELTPLPTRSIYVASDAPRYETGAKVTISFISLAVVLYGIQWANFLRLNRKHKNLSTEERQRWIDEGRDGDAHPDFRFPQ
jgi:hypothetical protein